MTVKVTREAEPQIELYGAYSGQLDGNGRVSLTFVAADTYLIMVPKNAVSRPQLELGSFATSYIPTAASTVTRNADVASVATSQFPYSATEGTLVVAWSMIAAETGTGYPSAVQMDNGTANAYIAVRQEGTSDFRRYGVVQNGASVTAMLNLTAETLTANTVLKAGIAYKENDFAFARDATLGTASIGTVPVVDTMRLGRNEANIFINSHIRQITYIPRRLTNAELQARTA
jgi:hypothetical protein